MPSIIVHLKDRRTEHLFTDQVPVAVESLEADSEITPDVCLRSGKTATIKSLEPRALGMHHP